MKKRSASIALSLAMCLTLLPTAAYAEDVSEGGAFDSQSDTSNGAAVVENEEGNTALYSGSGTKEEPYQISKAGEFYAFAKWYNENQHDGKIYAELTADINLNEGYTFTENGYTGDVEPEKWTPIGSGDYFPTYLGEFDGNGHTISGLYIKEDGDPSLATGLFGYFQGYLHDVKIENSYISSKGYCTGAFAGVVHGKIENCTADAVVSSDAGTSYFLDGTGGIVGNLYYLKSEALNCTFLGSVSSDQNPYVGGIVGDNLYGHVAGCTNLGRVTSSTVAVGGIVGQNRITYDSDETAEGESSVIERCINNGSISGTNSGGDVSVGGIVGVSSLVDGSSSEEPYIGAIRNCLNTGNVSGSVTGGIAGSLETSTNVENCLNIGAVSGTPAGAIAGVQLSSCKIADSYYRENGSLTAVGQLGTSNGSSTPSEDEKISDEKAGATEDQTSSGEISWKLNTNNGTQANSEIWAINAGVPTLAVGEVKPTYRVVFAFPDETKVFAYTSADGTAEIPVTAQNMALTYQNGEGETKIFTGNTVVTADMTVTVAEKQACTAPVFEQNIDTLTEETDNEAQFTLKEEPVRGAIFKIYSAETEGKLVGTASCSGTTLTVTLNPIPTSNTTYYISMETPNTKESVRTAVVVNAYKKPASSSGGGGGSTPRYAVTVPDKTENGSLSVSSKNAKKGSDVTITATPDKGYEVDDIVAKDANGNKLTLKDNGDGTYTFTMPASKVTIEATFAEKQADEPVAPEKLFADVSAEEYYYEAVKWASENGVTGGIGENLFGANLPCTRAQIVTFLWRAAGSPEPKDMSGFVDVSADAYYAKAVAWAVEEGIVSGTSATTFSPDAVCTRAQSVAFLYRAFGEKVNKAAGFSDVSADAYYADAVAWAVENGVASGIGGGLFAPDQDCARGQIVAFLYRAYQNK